LVPNETPSRSKSVKPLCAYNFIICHRIGRPPISTMGLGRYSVSSRKRVPRPPHSITTFTRFSWQALMLVSRILFIIQALDKGRTLRRLASASKEKDSISPVPIPSLSCQSGQGPDQTADIRGRNCSFIHKNHAAVRSIFFRPGFEQGRNRPPVIGYKR